MKEQIIVFKKNESFLNIDCSQSVLGDIAESFEFYVEGYKYTPKYRAGIWDGKIKLLDQRFGTLPLGLFDQLKEVAKSFDYEIVTKSNQFGSPDDKDDVTVEQIEAFIKTLNIHSKGVPIEARGYQIEAIHKAITNQRQILLVPTAGGKSFIGAVILRWYMSKGLKHLLFVVPTIGLLNQFKADLLDYFSESDFDVEENVQLIGGGSDKTVTKPIIISTWQSIFKSNSDFYNKIDLILGDEAHSYKADACSGIFTKATNTKYKFGMTGSLDESATNKMALTGIIGVPYRIRTTRELIDDGSLSDIKIKCLMLKYGKETKKLFKSVAVENKTKQVDYPTEIQFLCDHSKRNNFIRNLALAQKGVTLLLFNRIEHGKHLTDLIKDKVTDQVVYYVSGEIKADEREEIRQLCSIPNKNIILIASTGTTSTGINAPLIANIIFAHPTKSVIKVMQSIGRGLRKVSGKTHLNLYDIADAINTSKSNSNHTFRHFAERLALYCEEEHDYRLLEIELER